MFYSVGANRGQLLYTPYILRGRRGGVLLGVCRTASTPLRVGTLMHVTRGLSFRDRPGQVNQLPKASVFR